MHTKNCLKYFAVLFVALVWLVASSGLAADRNVAYLHQKDLGNWSYNLKGAWGKLTWSTTEGKTRFIFKGRKLRPNFSYTLVNFVDPFPGTGSICIAKSTSDGDGNLRLNGIIHGPLPRKYDQNRDTGAKIWLVNSSDIDCQNQKFLEGEPENYLYDSRRITIP